MLSRPQLLFLSLSIALSACANPLWRYDDFKLEASFTGVGCSVRLDGKPIVESGGGRVLVIQDDEIPPGVRSDQRVTTFDCNGATVSVLAPIGKRPRGVYSVSYADGTPSDGVAVVSLRHQDLPRGYWLPARLTGIVMHGMSGSVRIDRIGEDFVLATVSASLVRTLQPP